jgi:hypothetical protein
MFARFHQTPSRLQVSLRESRRIDGKPRCEHIASLGSIPEPTTTADRVAFWARLHQRLAKLSNRIGAEDQEKILGSVHARIPMVTIDDMRAVQRENAEADEKFWSGLQGMDTEQAEGHKELAAKSARIAAAPMPSQERQMPPKEPPLLKTGSNALRRARPYRAASASR